MPPKSYVKYVSHIFAQNATFTTKRSGKNAHHHRPPARVYETFDSPPTFPNGETVAKLHDSSSDMNLKSINT